MVVVAGLGDLTLILIFGDGWGGTDTSGLAGKKVADGDGLESGSAVGLFLLLIILNPIKKKTKAPKYNRISPVIFSFFLFRKKLLTFSLKLNFMKIL